MIPRFIVKNCSMKLIEQLQKMGYDYKESVMPETLMVIGRNLCKAVEGKNELVKVFDYTGEQFFTEDGPNEIIYQAYIHLQWQDAPVKATELKVGSKNLPVYINKEGVLIDSYVVRIDPFRRLVHVLKCINVPEVATHKPTIDMNVHFIEIGCALYSLNDLQRIIKIYDTVKELQPDPSTTNP